VINLFRFDNKLAKNFGGNCANRKENFRDERSCVHCAKFHFDLAIERDGFQSDFTRSENFASQRIRGSIQRAIENIFARMKNKFVPALTSPRKSQ
jgi:hypothetical protein